MCGDFLSSVSISSYCSTSQASSPRPEAIQEDTSLVTHVNNLVFRNNNNNNNNNLLLHQLQPEADVIQYM